MGRSLAIAILLVIASAVVVSTFGAHPAPVNSQPGNDFPRSGWFGQPNAKEWALIQARARALLADLDLGMTPAAVREIVRRHDWPASAQSLDWKTWILYTASGLAADGWVIELGFGDTLEVIRVGNYDSRGDDPPGVPAPRSTTLRRLTSDPNLWGLERHLCHWMLGQMERGGDIPIRYLEFREEWERLGLGPHRLRAAIDRAVAAWPDRARVEEARGALSRR